MLERLNGLPFVCLKEDLRSVTEVLGTLLDGSKFRAADVERVWNEALIFDAIEEPGAWLNLKAESAPRDVEIMVHAERLFGCEIVRALPIFLGMPKTAYAAFEQRPRVRWPRNTVN
jgi:hypothetical protein